MVASIMTVTMVDMSLAQMRATRGQRITGRPTDVRHCVHASPASPGFDACADCTSDRPRRTSMTDFEHETVSPIVWKGRSSYGMRHQYDRNVRLERVRYVDLESRRQKRGTSGCLWVGRRLSLTHGDYYRAVEDPSSVN